MRCRIPERDLHQKLDNTICRWNNEPVYVRVDGSELHFYDVRNITGKMIMRGAKPSDERFDVSSIPLGYINVSRNPGNRTYYLARLPLRRVKQGLSNGTVKITALSKRPIIHTVNQTLYGDGLFDMVMGRYPSLEETLASLRKSMLEGNEEFYEKAISRDIALSINKMGIIDVHYKTEFVGWIQPNKNIVHIPHNGLSWVVSKYLSHGLGWEID